MQKTPDSDRPHMYFNLDENGLITQMEAGPETPSRRMNRWRL